MVRVAVIGTGNMGRGLARMLAAAGHEVHLGSREPFRAVTIAQELDARIAGESNQSAARHASIVFLAYHSNAALLDELAPLLDGKIVVDISTYLDEPAPHWNALFDEVLSSSQEETARRLPNARVLGAFQNTWAQLFDEPLLDGRRTPVFIAGDDAAAKRTLIELVVALPFDAIDAGPLVQARKIAANYFVVAALNARYRGDSRRDWRITVRALNSLLMLALT